jgi:hypothetical protein
MPMHKKKHGKKRKGDAVMEIIKAEEILKEGAKKSEVENQPVASSEAQKEKPENVKKIVITILKEGLVNVECTGIRPWEAFGMFIEAERLIKQNLEMQERLAIEAALQQQMEVAKIRQGIVQGGKK